MNESNKNNSTISCQLQIVSDSIHLQQLYTGFDLLDKQGLINLTQNINSQSSHYQNNKYKVAGVHTGGLRAIVNQNIKVFYDAVDAHALDHQALAWCDIYFKRSFNHSIHQQMSDKVAPLDLNFMVHNDFTTLNSIQRRWAFGNVKDKIKAVIRELDTASHLSYLPRLKELHCPPQPELPFNILFITRLWEPQFDQDYDLTPKQIADRKAINDMRIDCIRALKKEYGALFTGGVINSAYAQSICPDIVFSQSQLTQKRQYLNFLRQFSVCITTTGLAGSIGWKFGEYIALSKAVVSEELLSQTFGQIQEGKHYLAFNNTEQCLEQVKSLMNDEKRYAMMQNNYQYYLKFLSPDKLVLNSLKRVLSMPR
ncbi:hypothetical protein [Thalassotalea aquiviva]|uniref:hypothetical protein n=1 Tax=Thalassotalea aquiviva TaxID=3242415 RepID=UPI003529FB32